jgi:hypothetical protein
MIRLFSEGHWKTPEPLRYPKSLVAQYAFLFAGLEILGFPAMYSSISHPPPPQCRGRGGEACYEPAEERLLETGEGVTLGWRMGVSDLG